MIYITFSNWIYSINGLIAVCKEGKKAIQSSIKELEDTLQTKLFIRERNGIKLTDDGEKLMFYAQKALNSLITAEKIITEIIEKKCQKCYN